MKKYVLAAICFLFLSSNVYALDLSRVKTWATSEVLTAADLNGEFNNILNHSLTNNDIDAAAGIVGSKLDLSAPGIIGATTPAAGSFTTLTLTGALTQSSTSRFSDKVSFTQTDNLEYIDSLADGFLDFEATTGLRLRINATEQINLIDGALEPTTDDDINLGSASKEFKDLYIDGTANIDSLVADTVDINGGTLDGVQIGGTTATGELIVNDFADDANGLGSQGTSGQVLQSAGAGANPTWATIGSTLISATSISATTNSGDITVEASKFYRILIRLTLASADLTVSMRMNSGSGANYKYLRHGLSTPSSPAAVDVGNDSATEILLGSIDDGANTSLFIADLILETTVVGVSSSRTFGTVFDFTTGGLLETATVAGQYNPSATNTTDFEIFTNGANMTGTVYLYEYNLTP